jgi:DNA-binding CsgD family transcriptional regulator
VSASQPAEYHARTQRDDPAAAGRSHHRTRWLRGSLWIRAVPFAGDVLLKLRRLGGERRIVTHPRAKTGWDSLTDSELKVINLIAQGATNRSVATQLHLSLHTVKTHVHNAFAKLGITSRAQLAQLMRGAD